MKFRILPRPKRERKVPAHLKGDFESPFALTTPAAGGGGDQSSRDAATSNGDQDPETSAEVRTHYPDNLNVFDY